MLTNNLRLTLTLTLFSFFIYICSFAQNSASDQVVSTVTLNSETSEQTENNEEKEDIIKKRKSDSKVKNSLTGRELTFEKGKISFKFKYGGRIQTRFDLSRIQEEGAKTENELYFRRVRFKSDGHLFSPKLGYKLEIDLIKGQILDAFLKWNFYQNFEVWAGQTKLRGNRERVMSSQNLQLVDRSMLNSKFNLDRDIGVWLMYHFNTGQSVWKQAVSVSKGEGRSLFLENPAPIDHGLDYTARIEYLPFGGFTNKGDYSGSDLEREATPKLSLGLTYDYNQNAVKSRGQLGSTTDSEANLRSWIADLMFKYRGFSVMSEFVDRKVYDFQHQTIEQYNDYVSDFYTGQAFNIQSGYVFKRNYEVAARYTQVRPQETGISNDLTEYTFALSKFIVQHKIKAQTDFTIHQEAGKPVTHIYRLQFELAL
jgi:hypothetical protein